MIEGTPGRPRIQTEKQVRKKRKHMFPPSDAVFDKWLAEADNRYVRWAEECNMTREQAKMIYYYDVTVRGEMLKKYSNSSWKRLSPDMNGLNMSTSRSSWMIS